MINPTHRPPGHPPKFPDLHLCQTMGDQSTVVCSRIYHQNLVGRPPVPRRQNFCIFAAANDIVPAADSRTGGLNANKAIVIHLKRQPAVRLCHQQHYSINRQTIALISAPAPGDRRAAVRSDVQEGVVGGWGWVGGGSALMAGRGQGFTGPTIGGAGDSILLCLCRSHTLTQSHWRGTPLFYLKHQSALNRVSESTGSTDKKGSFLLLLL